MLPRKILLCSTIELQGKQDILCYVHIRLKYCTPQHPFSYFEIIQERPSLGDPRFWCQHSLSSPGGRVEEVMITLDYWLLVRNFGLRCVSTIQYSGLTRLQHNLW